MFLEKDETVCFWLIVFVLDEQDARTDSVLGIWFVFPGDEWFFLSITWASYMW